MSTYTSEPGTRLAGRYRLVDQTSAGTGWTYWKATDETLARPVTVLTFAKGFPRIGETVTAARAASRLNDSRFAQVFDVEDGDEIAYVVLEWVRGESLTDLLAEGPLDPRRASTVVTEAARAIAAAHRSGQAHLHLQPSCVHWTPGGGVKIRGLGIDAALAGTELTDSEDTDVTDTRGLGMLLYAALTGYWPGPDSTALPPAPPDSSGEPCTPRQVAAGVPAGLDGVTCRALFQQENRQGPALTTPAEFADALSQVAPPALPLEPATFSTPRPPDHTQPTRTVQPADGYRRRHPTDERSAVARAVVSAAIVLVLAAVGVGAWAISRSLHQPAATPTAHPSQSVSGTGSASAALLKPVSASVFNLVGTADDPADAQNVIDPSAGKSWHTQYYLGYPQFGRLKSGVGIILNMGAQVRLSQVNVQFGTTCCTHADIELGSSATASQANLNSFTTVASSTAAQGNTSFAISNTKATGQYVLIWITYLPPLAGQTNQYQAQIYDVTVRGTSG
jgi:hypothetical protein